MAKMRGQDVIMESLLAEGVDCVFGNPGSTEAGFMDALQDYPQIKYYLGLHEGIAISMAEGYARASGKPAVVNLHAAPGTGNAMGQLWNAYKGRTPMVVTCGQQHTNLVTSEPTLGSNSLVEWARPTTKWAVQVERGCDLHTILRRAFKVATTPPTGPVYVAIPADIQRDEVEVVISPSRVFPSKLRPDSEAVERARGLLREARCPALFVGDGVGRSGAVAEAVRVAELLGAKVFVNRCSELSFPTNHPLFLGPLNLHNLDAVRQQLVGIDVILAVGGPLFSALNPLPGPVLSVDQKVIHLDSDPWEIGKNDSVAVGMLADPKMGLMAIGNVLEDDLTAAPRQAAEERTRYCRQEKESLRAKDRDKVRAGWDDVPISDPRLFAELAEVIPANAIVVDGVFSVSMAHHVDFTEPGSWIASSPGRTLGWAVGSALGVKIARPDRPVVAVVGDGELLFGLQALWSAAHYDLPIVCIVANNKGYESVKVLVTNYARAVRGPERKSALIGTKLVAPELDLAAIARGFGLWATRVERPEDLKAGLGEAFAAARPALVDVVIEGAVDRANRLFGGALTLPAR